MRHAQQLRIADVRAVGRVLGEVRELGADPAAWRGHAVTAIGRLIGATVGISVEVARWRPTRQADIAMLVDLGWRGEAERREFHAFVAGPAFADDPFIRRRARLGDRAFTVVRDQIIDDRTWYAAATVSDGRRMSDIDHPLNSSRPLPGGGADELAFHRPWGDTPFDARERRVVRFFHDELAHLWRRRADRPPGPGDDLPRHLRQALDRLLGGRSEKEAAADLGISRHTLHGYARDLYRRLGVATRAELMVKCLPAQYDFTPRLVAPTRT